MPPVFVLALGLMGAAALVRWCVEEVRRANADLDDVRATSTVEPIDRGALPTLKRDRTPARTGRASFAPRV